MLVDGFATLLIAVMQGSEVGGGTKAVDGSVGKIPSSIL